MLMFLLVGLQSCSTDEPFNDDVNADLESENLELEKRGFQEDCLRKIETLVIDHLGQVGHGFNFKEYFVEDWTGDGILDILGLTNDGRMIFYKGNVYNDGISPNPPNTTEDPGRTDWKYSLISGVQVGSGWDNFTEFYPADWTGNGITDMMAYRNNNVMFLYKWTGSSFMPGITVGGPSPGVLWKSENKRMVVHLNSDNRADLIEITDVFGEGYLSRLAWNGSYFSSFGFAPGYDIDYDYYPFDFNHDKVTDLMIRKPDGTLHYRNGIDGTGSGYSSEKQVGNGWNVFMDIYPGNHWSFCTTISSLTGRRLDGDLYSYVWNPTSESFAPGHLVGTGWDNFTHIFTGDITSDIFYRHDFIGRRYDGKLHAYGTVLDLE